MGVYDEHKPEIGSGKYLKPEDGKTYSLKICSAPAIFENVFTKPDGEEQISTRYAWVVYNLTDNIPQVFQLPPTGYKAIADLATNAKWGDPADGKYDIDYKRTGTGLDTAHSIIPTPADGPLDKEQQAAVKAIDLIDSIEVGKGAQRVQWLADALSGAPAREKAPAKPTSTPKKDDVVIEDIGDEPINLDDIPF